MSSSRFPRYLLYALAGIVLMLALVIWGDRRARSRQALAMQEASGAQRRAVALLYRAVHAENEMTYWAVSRTIAAYGQQKIENTAHVTHSPDRLLIEYVEGSHKGFKCGYSERWFWRECQNQNDTRRAIPFADLQRAPDAMSAKRFALLLNNYNALWIRSDTVDGRPVEVVFVRPAREIEGARGPARRLWIDRETGLPLRVETFDHQMRPTMHSSLSKVNYQPRITPATFAAPAAIKRMAEKEPWVSRELGDDRAAAQRMAGVAPPQPRYLPPGFAFDGVGVQQLRLSNATSAVASPPRYAAFARYTDGLNTLSLFAVSSQNLPPGAQEIKNCDFGSGTLVMSRDGDNQLAAVADLPMPLLLQVLEGPAQK